MFPFTLVEFATSQDKTIGRDDNDVCWEAGSLRHNESKCVVRNSTRLTRTTTGDINGQKKVRRKHQACTCFTSNSSKVLIPPNKHTFCTSARRPSLNKHHLLLPLLSPSSSLLLTRSLSLSLAASLLSPFSPSLFPLSTHISLSGSLALCCTTELRSLPAISTLHLWNPSWLPRPFTVEGCHLPHGGAGGGT